MTTLPNVGPMLASPQGSTDLRTLVGTHTFDIKLDGLRCLLYWDGQTCKLVNRSGKDVTAQYPEITTEVGTHWGITPVVLDGEIVANSGSFQDTARRGKQNNPLDIKQAAKAYPVTYVAFDLLYQGLTDLRSEGYLVRRANLEAAFDFLLPSPNKVLTESVVSDDPVFFDTVKAQGMEGVIAKRNDSTYRGGRFSDWIKFKATRSITAIGIGYEKGEGSRAHFGAMFLALVSESNDIVEIGRVGTGFKAADIAELKAEMDAGRVVVVEIECLNKSQGGQLRFPVYKGVRTDLSVADATVAQLDQIPTM